MTQDDDVISRLNCAWNKKEQGHMTEALEELLEASIILVAEETPRAEERIKKRCRECKDCIKEDKEDDSELQKYYNTTMTHEEMEEYKKRQALADESGWHLRGP